MVVEEVIVGEKVLVVLEKVLGVGEVERPWHPRTCKFGVAVGGDS